MAVATDSDTSENPMSCPMAGTKVQRPDCNKDTSMRGSPSCEPLIPIGSSESYTLRPRKHKAGPSSPEFTNDKKKQHKIAWVDALLTHCAGMLHWIPT